MLQAALAVQVFLSLLVGLLIIHALLPKPIQTIMAKIKLGNRPKSFKRIVTIDMLEGTKGTVEIEYKYRTKTEFGKFVDEMISASGDAVKSDEDQAVVIQRVMEKTRDNNAAYILKVAEGWNLDAPFDLEHAQQLCDELPGAAHAIIETYRLAVSEGRLGN